MESAKNVLVIGAAWNESLWDRSPIAQLVLEHYDREQLPLRRYLVFIGVNVETAEDLVQDSFIKLHEHLLKGGDRSYLRAWLYRVAHNLARNHQASFRTGKMGSLSELGHAADLPAASESAEDQLLATERMERLQRALQDLSEAQRSCLMLRSQGLKYREIAQVLETATSTVAENVQRGLNRLKEML